MTHKISADHLSIEKIGEIITKGIKLELSDDARQRTILAASDNSSKNYPMPRVSGQENRDIRQTRLWRDNRFRIAVQNIY